MMSGEILYMDSGMVKLTEEGLSLVSFSDLYNGDKNTGKPMFRHYIDAIWHVYSKSSPFYSLSFEMRVEEFNRKAENNGKKGWNTLTKDMRFIECCKEYDNITKTHEDRQYERLIKDAQTYIEYLEKIPLEKEVRAQDKIVNPESGEEETRWIYVKVPNFKERKEARQEIEEQYKFIDRIKERLAGQQAIKNRKYVRIFDNLNG